MTRIDFYILTQHSEQERYAFASRLCEKAYRQGMSTMILTADEQCSLEVDKQLWQSSPESFIPHPAAIEEPFDGERVLISHGKDFPEQQQLLINLSHDVPEMFSRFERVIEIVVQNSLTLEATRKHFAFYKSRGYPINTHKI